jgi:hypothetical protein
MSRFAPSAPARSVPLLMSLCGLARILALHAVNTPIWYQKPLVEDEELGDEWVDYNDLEENGDDKDDKIASIRH